MPAFHDNPAINAEITRIAQIADPLERARKAIELMDAFRNGIGWMATVRAQAIEEMRVAGKSAASIAEDLGISRQQVHKIAQEHAHNQIADSDPARRWVLSSDDFTSGA